MPCKFLGQESRGRASCAHWNTNDKHVWTRNKHRRGHRRVHSKHKCVYTRTTQASCIKLTSGTPHIITRKASPNRSLQPEDPCNRTLQVAASLRPTSSSPTAHCNIHVCLSTPRFFCLKLAELSAILDSQPSKNRGCRSFGAEAQ